MISEEEFADKTSLLLNIVAETVINDMAQKLTEDQKEWFSRHVSKRVRFLFDNDPLWKERCLGQNRREFVYEFVEHWMAGMNQNPDTYMRRHPEDVLC